MSSVSDPGSSKDSVESGRLSASSSRALRQELFDDRLLDSMLERVEADGLSLTGQGGFLPELVKAVLERGLAVELSDHLGYGKYDRAGRFMIEGRRSCCGGVPGIPKGFPTGIVS